MTDSGELIGVEMQVKRIGGMDNRIVYYQAKNMSSILKRRQEYANMNKVISICIMVENYLPDTENFHSIFRYKSIETGNELTDISEIQFVELGKIDTSKPLEEMSELERYGLFLMYANEEKMADYVEKLKSFGDEVILMSDAILRKYTEDEILAELAEDREMFLIEQDAMRIRYENLQKAIAEKNNIIADKDNIIASKDKDYARKLKQKGMSVEEIAEITELPATEIEKL